MPAERSRSVLLVHPSTELYGSDRVFLETVAACVDQGWTTTAVLPGEGPLGPLLEAAGASVRLVPMPVLRKAYLTPRGLVRLLGQVLRQSPSMVRALREARPDVVYLSTVTAPLWAVLARLLRRPVVIHVHEAEEDAHRLVRLGLSMPLLLARRVLANSELSRDVVVQDISRLAARTVVVYNGVPGPTSASLPRARLRAPLRLVLVGRLSPRKGTDVAVAALARLRESGVDATLTLVGTVFSGYEWFEQQLHDQAESLGLADHVFFLGQQDSVWPALAAADIALVPSRVEPFGNAAVEAMLALRPVVASAAQGLREVIDRPEVGRLVAPDDPEALAAAITEIRAGWTAVRAGLEATGQDAVRRFDPQRYRDDIVNELSPR